MSGDTQQRPDPHTDEDTSSPIPQVQALARSLNRPGVRQTLLLVLTACAWLLLARVLYVEAPSARPLPLMPPLSMVAIGIRPWFLALLILQLAAAVSPRFARWSTRIGSSDTYIHLLVALATCVLALLSTDTFSWARTAHNDEGVPLLPHVSLVRVVTLLALGSLALSLAALALRRLQLSSPLSLFAVATIAISVAHHADGCRYVLADLADGTSFGALAVLLPTVVLLLLAFSRFTLPQPADGTKGASISIPFLAAGIGPYLFQTAFLLPWDWTLARLASSTSPAFQSLAEQLSTPTASSCVATALLVIGVPVCLRVLYPYRSLAALYGPDADRVHQALTSWRSGFLPRAAALLLVPELSYDLGNHAYDKVGLGNFSEWLPLLVIATASTIRSILQNHRLHVQYGALDQVAQVLGPLAASTAQDLLASAHIPCTLLTWTVPELHPLTVPGGGEIRIVVPAQHTAGARDILSAYFTAHPEAYFRLLTMENRTDP